MQGIYSTSGQPYAESIARLCCVCCRVCGVTVAFPFVYASQGTDGFPLSLGEARAFHDHIGFELAAWTT